MSQTEINTTLGVTMTLEDIQHEAVQRTGPAMGKFLGDRKLWAKPMGEWADDDIFGFVSTAYNAVKEETLKIVGHDPDTGEVPTEPELSDQPKRSVAPPEEASALTIGHTTAITEALAEIMRQAHAAMKIVGDNEVPF
jgi:hypothetical protein